MTTVTKKILVQLNTVYIDDETWYTSLEDMLKYDSGVMVKEDKKSGEILVELSKCTVARWESFGFKVIILNWQEIESWRMSWLVKGFTQAEVAQMKKNAEEYEYSEFEKANLARGFCADGCCGPDEDEE